MVSDWNVLSEELQLTLSQEALRHAADTIAGHAETLAGEIEAGALSDRGGVEALRLFAAVVRAIRPDAKLPAGHA